MDAVTTLSEISEECELANISSKSVPTPKRTREENIEDQEKCAPGAPMKKAKREHPYILAELRASAGRFKSVVSASEVPSLQDTTRSCPLFHVHIEFIYRACHLLAGERSYCT